MATVGTVRESGGLVARLCAVVDELVGSDPAGLDERALVAEIEQVGRQVRRLEARLARLGAERVRRETLRQQDQCPARDPVRSRRAAEGEVARELAGQLKVSPGQARRLVETGRQADRDPEVGEGLDAGTLTAAHARLMADTLGRRRADAAAAAVA